MHILKVPSRYKTLKPLTLEGPNSDNFVLYPLALHNVENQLHIFISIQVSLQINNIFCVSTFVVLKLGLHYNPQFLWITSHLEKYCQVIVIFFIVNYVHHILFVAELIPVWLVIENLWQYSNTTGIWIMDIRITEKFE